MEPWYTYPVNTRRPRSSHKCCGMQAMTSTAVLGGTAPITILQGSQFKSCDDASKMHLHSWGSNFKKVISRNTVVHCRAMHKIKETWYNHQCNCGNQLPRLEFPTCKHNIHGWCHWTGTNVLVTSLWVPATQEQGLGLTMRKSVYTQVIMRKQWQSL